MKVKEVVEGEELKNGVCYIAKGNHHLELVKNNNKVITKLNQKSKIHGTRPSIDITIKY